MLPLEASQHSEGYDDDGDGSKSPAELEHWRTQIPLVLSWNTFHVIWTEVSILYNDSR